MKSFKVTASHSDSSVKILSVDNFVYDSDAIRQELQSRCQLVRGELPYNTALGVPLGADKDVIDLSIINLICTSAGVKELVSFSSSFTARGIYTASVKVRTIYDDLIEVNI